MIRADSIKVSDDEGRYTLTIESDYGIFPIVVDIHDLVLDFYAQVQREIRPYVLEAEMSRFVAALPELVTNRPVSVEDAVEAGYALDDPKSPGYHDRMVD